MKYGFVYRWTNKANGKKYVGSHYGFLDDAGKKLQWDLRRESDDRGTHADGLNHFATVVGTSGDWCVEDIMVELKDMMTERKRMAMS